MRKTTNVLWTSRPTTLQNYFFLCKPRPGVFASEAHTAGITVFLCIYTSPAPETAELQASATGTNRFAM